jgi:hypothetical protein
MTMLAVNQEDRTIYGQINGHEIISRENGDSPSLVRIQPAG